jgi:hypothetical protein
VDFQAHAHPFHDAPKLEEVARIDRIGPYHGYSEQLARWQDLVDSGAKAFEVGKSVLDRPIFALQWGPEDAEETCLAMAGIHAMEWIGVETLHRMMQSLVDSEPIKRRLVFVPIVNVDGFLRVEDDLRNRRARFRRGNAHGVDLNRNWPTHFRSFNLAPALLPFLGKSGKAALSEPEIAAMMSLIENLERTSKLKTVLSMHSFGKMILLPYGGRWRRPEGFDSMAETAQKLKGTFHEKYTVRQCARWVPGFFARGMELDSIADHSGAEAILIECSGGGLSLWRPRSWFSPFRWFNPKAPEATVEGLAPGLKQLLLGTL